MAGKVATESARLVALRRSIVRLEELLLDAPPASAASIARELRQSWADLDELSGASVKESTLDELKQRRDVKSAEPVAPSRRRSRVAGG